MAPEVIILITMIFGLTLYALFGGADFGAGVWEFNTVLLASPKERALIYRAIGPVWEANHVWLIFVLVGMFGAFPPAFAAMCRALWLPLLLALVGIVFRGVGFAFRSYATDSIRQQEVWGAVFALASTSTPFFLGAAIGALASGTLEVTADGQFQGDYLTGWLTPLAIFNGFLVVAMCAYLASLFLTREAFRLGDEQLTQLWRRRALSGGGWMGILSMAGLAMVATQAPELWSSFRERSLPLVAGSVVAGFISLAAMWNCRYLTAIVGGVIAVATVIWGWAVAQYPLLIPPIISIENAKAPTNVLWYLAGSIALGAVLLLPSLTLLFYLFKGKQPEIHRALSETTPT